MNQYLTGVQTRWDVIVRAPGGLLETGGICTLTTCGTALPVLNWPTEGVTLAQATAACLPCGLAFFEGCLIDVFLGNSISFALPDINTATKVSQFAKNCVPNPCQNGGVCQVNSTGNGFKCTCPATAPPGLTCGGGGGGGNCPVNNCAGSGGTCITDPNSRLGYTCTYPACPLGFVGSACQWPNPCTATSCANGGHCSLTQNAGNGITYICTCTGGFTGAICNVSP